MNATMNYAWHYTIREYLPRIQAFGILLPASTGVRPPEQPILWFSLNQRFEMTARKMGPDIVTGRIRTLSIEETRERYGGLVRFGTDPGRLLEGEALRRVAKMRSKVWARLREVGLRQGANPAEWLGHVGELPIAGMRIEVMDDGGHWTPLMTAPAGRRQSEAPGALDHVRGL